MNLAIRDMLTNFDAPDDSPRRSLRDLHFGMRRASSRNPAGIPRFETASDDGDPAVLKNELESGIAELHNHLWTPLTETGLGGRPTLDYRNADFPEVMGEPARHGFEIDLDDSTPWLVPQHRPFQRFQRRVGMLRHQRVISEQELGTAYVVRPSIPPVLALLAYRSNQLAPPFLVFAGTITIDLKPVVEWTPLDRLAVQFDGKPLDELPSGWQRWVAITLRTAFRSLMQSEVWIPPLESGEAGEETDEREGIRRHAAAVMEDPQTAPQVFEVSPPTHGRTVLLIDEPEVHLHPDAASEVKEWLTGELADNGSSALVATHAPVFMDYRPDEATVYGLEPWGSRPDVDGADRGTRMYEASGNFVEWVEQCGSSLGISTFGALTFYRGFLLVEGPHDEEVIRHFYGDLLDSHRIGLVVLWGLRDEREARRLAESRFLKYAHKPVAVLLDNATLERVRDPSAAPRDITYEEHQLRRFMDEFDRARIPLHPASHGLTDIVAALPEEAVRRHLADDDVVGTFEGGWEEVESEIRRGPSLKSVDKKRKVQELLGLRVTTYGYSLDNLIKPVLDHSDGLRPTRPLEVAMEGVMAWFEDDGSRPR